MDITVCVLLYGDYPDLARRCLDPILKLRDESLVDLRIGANAISQPTRDYLDEAGLLHFDTWDSVQNMCKYPMMRRMFYERYLDTKWVMWFDDDSYISHPSPKDWLADVAQELEDADMLGSLYRVSLRGNQHLWIQDQPWYTGNPVRPGQTVWFATGGWWVIETSVLRRHDWPVPELLHRGGDVMLGELLRQQGLRLKKYRNGVAINADEQGRESRAVKRGFNSDPIGFSYRRAGA